MNFSILTSKTFWGAVIGAASLVGAEFANTGHVSPSTIVQAVAMIVTAVGVRDAIAKNGAGR